MIRRRGSRAVSPRYARLGQRSSACRPKLAVQLVDIDDLVSYWKLDETSGTGLDAHGDNDLTDNNTVTSAAGKIETARQFTRANSESLSVASNATLQMGDAQSFSMGGWFYLDSLPGGGTVYNLFGKWDGAGDLALEYNIQLFASSWRVRIGDGTSNLRSTLSVAHGLSTSTWYHVMVIYDAAAETFTLYVDNSQVAQNTSVSDGAGSGASRFLIGAEQGTPTTQNHHFDGRIDEVFLIKRALTSDDRANIYNEGNGLAYPWTE